ncbi:hypothetical protein D9M68_730340 [compost metagenome]
MFDYAAAIGPQGSETVGVVHHHPGTFGLCGGADGRQVGEVAIHAEHAVGDHQGIALGLFQAAGEACRIVVQVARKARTGQQAGIQQGRMVEAVFQHRVALAQQRGHRTQVGHVAGREQQRARTAGELGQRQLQLMVRAAVADHQVRGAATGAPLLRTIAQRTDHLGMVGQAQVVVGTEGQHGPAVHQYLRPLRTLQQRALAVEVFRMAGGKAGSEIKRHGRFGCS